MSIKPESKYIELSFKSKLSFISSLLSIMILSFSYSSTVNAALSATSANTIKGTEPYLQLLDGPGGTAGTKLTSLDELLGFSMWDGTYDGGGNKNKVQVKSTQSGTDIAVPAGMKYSDVVALITADGNSRTVVGAVVGDDDGDAAISANTSVTGNMTATWYKGTVNAANKVTDLTQGLVGGCDGTTYLLQIEANNVEANTTYGDPNINPYGNGGPITYTFKAPISPGGCIKYLQPKDLTVYGGLTSANSAYPGTGYSSKWEAGKGFKVNSGFPTTGFQYAIFSLIGSVTDQSKYRCSSPNNSTGKIILSGVSSTALGKGCTVRYNKMRKAEFIAGGTPTITLEYSADGSTGWTPIDSFTIPEPSKWAVVKGIFKYKLDDNPITNGVFPAASMCKNNTTNSVTTPTDAAKYFFSRAEITNAPNAYVVGSSFVFNNSERFSRDTNGASSTFTGEWGNLYNNYGGFGADDFVWSSDVRIGLYQFGAYTTNGYVGYPYPHFNSYLTMCRDP